jgi:hypothetical protein
MHNKGIGNRQGIFSKQAIGFAVFFLNYKMQIKNNFNSGFFKQANNSSQRKSLYGNAPLKNTFEGFILRMRAAVLPQLQGYCNW